MKATIASCLATAFIAGGSLHAEEADPSIAGLADAAANPPPPMGFPITTPDFEQLRWFPYPDEVAAGTA